ncbi:hypothetical protein J0H58_37525 [bacterium]|nr:hypothetical protein [bacterium]
MSDGTLTVEGTVHTGRRGRGGRKELRAGDAPALPPPGRVPRVARLMALAIKMEGLVRVGVVKDYAALARLGRVTRARVTQVLNLTLLAPDLQETLLFLPPVAAGREPLALRELQPIARLRDWRRQRRAWRELTAGRRVGKEG